MPGISGNFRAASDSDDLSGKCSMGILLMRDHSKEGLKPELMGGEGQFFFPAVVVDVDGLAVADFALQNALGHDGFDFLLQGPLQWPSAVGRIIPGADQMFLGGV